MIKSPFLRLKNFKNNLILQILLKLQKIESYINNKKYHIKLESHRVFNEYQIKFKIWKVFELLLNVIFTGLIVNYVMKHNNILSYGLAVSLIIYYLDIVVQIVKKPYITNAYTDNTIFNK